jgi:hypothetical protein
MISDPGDHPDLEMESYEVADFDPIIAVVPVVAKYQVL